MHSQAIAFFILLEHMGPALVAEPCLTSWDSEPRNALTMLAF